VIIQFITHMTATDAPEPEVNGPVRIANRVTDLSVHLLQNIPEEDVWLAGQLSVHTRRAYKQDVSHFVRTMNIRSTDELRLVTRAAVIAWLTRMKEEGAKPRTIRRRLSALSSLYAHLVDHRIADTNPVRDIKRPRVNRRTGTTRAFSPREARRVLDAPSADTLRGLRDRAILAVGFQAGPRRAEIASLTVGDFHTNNGYKSLHFVRKGGEDLSLALNPQTAQRIQDYLDAAGHSTQPHSPLFRGVPKERRGSCQNKHLHPETVDRILKKYCRLAGLDSGYTAHSMRATFVTTALNNGASLEDVQRDCGHADPTTTKLYDRRGYNPEKSAAFFAVY
jgi:integrase/recombinase XerD